MSGAFGELNLLAETLEVHLDLTFEGKITVLLVQLAVKMLVLQSFQISVG